LNVATTDQSPAPKRLGFFFGSVLECYSMANVTGPQLEIKYCPRCKSDLKNVPRGEMKSGGYKRKDGTIAKHTHTYDCISCGHRFEINQAR
jgi:uncharacterized protein with PIN domain